MRNIITLKNTTKKDQRYLRLMKTNLYI